MNSHTVEPGHARASISLGLLCGGRGRRLGGAKHQLVDADGRTLLQSQLHRLAPHFAEVLLLTGPRNQQALPGARNIADPAEHEGKGPLAGLLCALEAASSEWVALFPLDVPFFPPEAFASALARAGARHGAIGFLDSDARFQWLPGLYHRRLRDSVEEALCSDDLSFGRWVKSVERAFLPWDYPQVDVARAFTNLNTPEAAAAAGYAFPNGG